MISTFRKISSGVTQNLTATYFKAQKLRTVGLVGFHSFSENLETEGIHVKILPAWQDNYMYLIIDPNTKDAANVDPVDPDSVIQAVKDENGQLGKILTTHLRQIE